MTARLCKEGLSKNNWIGENQKTTQIVYKKGVH